MDSQNPTPKQQVVERLRQGQSIVVTVVRQPSVDEVAAAIGLTSLLDRFGKKVTAIVSSPLPSVLDFLDASDLISHNVDRLRDFVIELDKNKADKLRYKAEDEVVKVFITPYQSVITEQDLRFSQGDYNVDTVIVIGATTRDDIDKVLTDHSRLMQDATVVTINAGQKAPRMGSINWHEPEASSVGEMLVSVSDALQPGLMEAQSAQALLSSIVSATDGFRNQATTPKVMTMAAQLMASGADQQAVMTHFQILANTDKAEVEEEVPTKITSTPADSDDKSAEAKTTLSIQHDKKPAKATNNTSKSEGHPAKSKPKTKPEPKMTITPEVKPGVYLEVKEGNKPKSTPHSQPDSNRDSDLAADAIDAMIDSSRQVNEQMESERQKVEAPAVDVPLLQHDAPSHATTSSSEPKKVTTPANTSSQSHVNLHPETPVWKQTASPQPQAAAPQPVSPQSDKPSQKPAETSPYSSDQRSKAVDEALKAVEQARASKPTEIREPLQALSSETLATEANISIDHTGQLSQADPNTNSV